MADYDWFKNVPATPSDGKVYGEQFNFTVFEKDPAANNLNKSARKMVENRVYCDWCQCSIRPAVFAMRQHRRACLYDSRVAGNENESLVVL